MTVKEYVDDILCIPITRTGNRLIVESIELVLDTCDHKFYKRLSLITGKTTRYLEKALRDARLLGLASMKPEVKSTIFGSTDVTTNEYILKATDFYRRNYENKEC